MATIVKVDPSGQLEIIQNAKPKSGDKFQYAELTEIVEGMIELVRLGDELVMFCNEEGKLIPEIACRPNSFATFLLAQFGGLPGDVVRGNVIIGKEEEFE